MMGVRLCRCGKVEIGRGRNVGLWLSDGKKIDLEIVVPLREMLE